MLSRLLLKCLSMAALVGQQSGHLARLACNTPAPAIPEIIIRGTQPNVWKFQLFKQKNKSIDGASDSRPSGSSIMVSTKVWYSVPGLNVCLSVCLVFNGTFST